MSPPTAAIPGYDVPAVEAWIAAHVSGLTPPLRWTRLEGGHSNLTYRLDDAQGRAAVIRRPPMGELLPKAHDMEREWQLISALGPTPVPVPAALGLCTDRSVTGANFYVMGLIDGHPLYTADDTLLRVPADRRMAFAHSFIDVLADLHAVDPDAVGLSGLGKKDGYVARQLNAWYRSWTASIDAAKYDDPRAHTLQKFFLENVPEQGPGRIVHGDYGTHNCLVGPDGTVAAVVDWEISTLGDPLADLAYALNWWPDPTDIIPQADNASTSVPGMPDRAYLARRYGERSGRDLSQLDYYLGFNRWKTAAIVHGVYARYVEGKKSSAGIDLDHMRGRIGTALTLAEQAVERLIARRPA
jgi:aminoglycoside phosphotransferase (APT) family kinase protein